MRIIRRKSRQVQVGSVKIGGNAPIVVQSMTKTDTRDVPKTVRQILSLEKVGCEIVRVAVPDMRAAQVLGKIKKKIHIPLVADVHFSAELGLKAMEQGIDKLRINPGNIKREGLARIFRVAKEKKIPVRIGVNSGSLSKKVLAKYHGKATAQAMIEQALETIKLAESLGFEDLVISLKANDIERTIKAYKILAKKVDYPFHLGITEAGTLISGLTKSALGIGLLLQKGIGDTIRVSLADSPQKEVKAGWEILKSLGLRERGPTVIACPSCGRAQIDVTRLAQKVEKAVENIKKPIRIAVMGCVVNGPGEAKEADIGIIGGKKIALITKKGKILKRVREEKIIKELLKEIKN